MKFWDEHFPDILMTFLIVFFVIVACFMGYKGYDKIAEACMTVSTGTLVGGLVMRFRTTTDPAITKMISNGTSTVPAVVATEGSSVNLGNKP